MFNLSFLDFYHIRLFDCFTYQFRKKMIAFSGYHCYLIVLFLLNKWQWVTLEMFLAAIFKKSMPKFLPIKSPFLIYLGEYPAVRYCLACLRIYPMRRVEVLVPSPANLLVELTDFLMRVQIASWNRSSCVPYALHIRCV